MQICQSYRCYDRCIDRTGIDGDPGGRVCRSIPTFEICISVSGWISWNLWNRSGDLSDSAHLSGLLSCGMPYLLPFIKKNPAAMLAKESCGSRSGRDGRGRSMQDGNRKSVCGKMIPMIPEKAAGKIPGKFRNRRRKTHEICGE